MLMRSALLNNYRMIFGTALLMLVCLLTGCAKSDALWGVVDKVCRVNYQQKHDPAPCAQIYSPTHDRRSAFTVIQNPRFHAHFILVPNARMSGIESPVLLEKDAPDYFGYAWTMRYRLAYEYGRPVPDDVLGLALNSAYGRSQNQLHIHLTCLREDVRRQLKAERPYIGREWTLLPDLLLRHPFYAKRIEQPALIGVNPIKSLADKFHLTPEQLAYYGVAVVPTTFENQPGFILLATRVGMGERNRASVESLLDKRCELLQTIPAQ